MRNLLRVGSVLLLVSSSLPLWAADPQPTGTAPANGKAEGQKDRYRNLELFQKVLHFIENNYVDEVKNKDLISGALKGMMDTLDPHSNFLPPDVYKDMRADTSGEFGGLGLEITVRDGVLTVVSPIEGTPAWRAGVQPGDRIVKINGESTKGLTSSGAVAKMRGKSGSPVQMTILRKGWERPKDISLKREIVKMRSVRSAELEPGYGYIRLTNFNESAARDIEAAMKELEKKEKLKGLVLDLRYNPGGLLDQAVDVCSLFVDEGLIVSTIGRNKEQKEVRYAKKGKARKDFPLAILVNSSSASASEIVSGALQDLGRAIVVGQQTFGKGSVQTVIELGEGSGLKLTIARYYTASGRSIQEKGVTPDIVLEEYDPALLKKAVVKRDALREKDLPGHLQGRSPEKKAGGGNDEFTQEELDTLRGAKGKGGGDEDEELAPLAMDPKKDYEVSQAVNYLKSYEVIRGKLQPQQKE